MNKWKSVLLLSLSLMATSCANNPHNENEVIGKILSQHKGNILTPELVKTSTPKIELNTGWGMKSKTFYQNHEPDVDAEYYVVRRFKNGAYSIDHFNQDKEQTSAKFKLKNGLLKLRNSTFREYSFASEFAHCQFVLGECEHTAYGFESDNFSPRITHTKFSNGVWIRKTQGFLGSRTVKEVYDLNGFLLFRSNKSQLRGKEVYSRRTRVPLRDVHSLYLMPPSYLIGMIKDADRHMKKCDSKYSDRLFQELGDFQWPKDDSESAFRWGELFYFLSDAYQANDCLEQTLDLLVQAKSLIERSKVQYPFMENIDFLIELTSSDLNPKSVSK